MQGGACYLDRLPLKSGRQVAVSLIDGVCVNRPGAGTLGELIGAQIVR